MAQNFICSADSYANIDYKKPVLFTQKDYRTSTGSHHRYIPPPLCVQYFSDKPSIGAYALKRNGKLQAETYKTTSGTAYIKRYAKPDTNEVSKTAGLCTATDYMTTVKEKMYKEPPMPGRMVISAYQETFVPKETTDIYVTPPSVHCRLQSNGTDEQPRTVLEAGGINKQLDPYLSTTRLAHFPFTADMQKWASADNLGTLWKSMKHPYTGPVPKAPIWDQTVFKKPIRLRIIPEHICRVPHLGKTSEYNAKYQPLTTHPMWIKVVVDQNHYPDSLSGPNKIMTQCAPAMYCTEKCHLGSDWGPGRVVDPKTYFKKRVLKHEIPCYSHMVP